jgi:single-strand DNA-binding protein
MTIIGNICADPRIGETPSGAKVANLRVAANEREKNAETGEYENKAEFFDVDIWRGVDTIEAYFTKGSGIGLAGDFGTREWTDRDGNVRTNLCLHNASWWFLPKSDGGERESAPAQKAAAPKAAAVDDTDIPF